MWWMLACVDPFPPSDADPLAPFSDEFDGNESAWIDIADEEGIQERVHLFEVTGGQAHLVPEGSAWYAAYRGVLLFQRIEGDFVATTHLTVSNGSGLAEPPVPLYSYAGLMARAAYDGYEDYVLIGVGTGEDNTPPQWVAEAKVTVHGQPPTVRTEADWDDGEGDLAIARLGTLMVLLERDDAGWTVRYHDCQAYLPPQLQVGMMAADDFYHCDTPYYDDGPVPYAIADVDARYDYVHFATPPSVADPCGTYGGASTGSDDELLALLAPYLD